MTAPDPQLDSPWHRLAPWPTARDEALRDIAAYLAEPATQAQLESCAATSTYPDEARAGLHARGLAGFFAEAPPHDDPARAPAGSRMTMAHLGALNELTASVDTGLCVTVAVTPFALLPVYLAAEPPLLREVFARVRAGAYGAMLLTELANGSNLLGNSTTAEGGALDGAGAFAPLGAAAAAPTHYRVTGRKDLINGGGRHELLTVFARTRGPAGDGSPLAARGDFSLFVVERDASVSSPQRWPTLPVPAADISSVELRGTVVPAWRRVGREGGGFALVQRTLAMSRGGVGAMAAGLARRATAMVADYAQRRAIYGPPILRLGAIADHLLRMRALELAVAALALKAAAALNAHGPAAGHYGAVAKYACCALAEAAVAEGRVALGSRALLAEHPYHRLPAEAALLDTFDGTTHLVLDQLAWRLAQLAAEPDGGDDAIATMGAVNAAAPRSLLAARASGAPLAVAPGPYLRRLAELPGELPLGPLADLAEALPALARACRADGRWDDDQGLRFALARPLALVEALVALVELGDGPRRAALGMAPHALGPAGLAMLPFAYGWLGGQVAAELRALALREGLTPPPGLADAEVALGRLGAAARAALRGNPSTLTGGS
ncbi:MAG TPA: acyl-CoA dehydrogenase family protein [Chloroflexaceae bacterium]|nr:acyl-CoA dehydrogenase family protein [Chloroflexaceae bacterium]